MNIVDLAIAHSGFNLHMGDKGVQEKRDTCPFPDDVIYSTAWDAASKTNNPAIIDKYMCWITVGVKEYFQFGSYVPAPYPFLNRIIDNTIAYLISIESDMITKKVKA